MMMMTLMMGVKILREMADPEILNGGGE